MQLTVKDLHAEVGSYLSEIEEFIDMLVSVFFKNITDGSILADEIVNRLRTAWEIADFFKRAAKRTLSLSDYQIFAKHMDIAVELFKRRNQFAHGVVYSLPKIELYKSGMELDNKGEKQGGGTNPIDLIAAELLKEPDCPFGIIPPVRKNFFQDVETFNDRFYCHTIWEVTRNKVRLRALRDVMAKGWAKLPSEHSLPFLEHILDKSGKPEFIDGIKSNPGAFYGPKSYT